jgi:hypothetical protein
VLGSAAAERFLPLKIAVDALKQSHLIDNPIATAFNVDGFAINQGIGDRISGPLNNPAEGRTGNPHAATCIFVGHPQQIGQSNGLTLIDREANFLQINHGNAPGFEVANFGIKRYHPVFLRSYHHSSFMRIFSKR